MGADEPRVSGPGDAPAPGERLYGDEAGAEAGATGHQEAGAGATPPQPVRRRRGRRILVAVVASATLAVGVGAALSRTARGQRAVLDLALSRVRGGLAGELAVDTIRSRDLLGGATLVGVSLDAEGGRPFLRADSIGLRYSALGLVVGRPTLAAVTVWGPRVEISRSAPDEAVNVARLLRPRPPAADSGGAPLEIELGRVRLEGGVLEILTPAPESGAAAGMRTVPDPGGGGSLRRIALEGLELEVDEALLRLGDPEPFTGFLAGLAADVSLFAEPIHLRGAEGRVSLGPGGLSLTEAFVRLPGSVARGSLEIGPRPTRGGAWAFAASLETEGWADLADLGWLDARVPSGRFEGAFSVTAGEGVELDLRDVELAVEGTTLQLDGGVSLAGGVALHDLVVDARPLSLRRLDPWLPRPTPLDGFVSGRVTLDGPRDAVHAEGRLTLVPEGFGGRPTTLDVHGTVLLGDDPGAEELVAVLDPLNLELLDAVRPGVGPREAGVGEVTLSGRASAGIDFTVVAARAPGAFPGSTVEASGRLQRDARGAWTADLEGGVSAFDLALLTPLAPAADLRGTVSGSVRALGGLEAMDVRTDLSLGEGRLVTDLRLNLLDPAARYEIDARGTRVLLSALSGRLPAPSRWSGRVRFSGRGWTPADVEATARVVAGSSRVGGLHVDSLAASVRAGAGVLTVDSVDLSLGGVEVRGSGTLGLATGRSGSARFTVRADSLLGLRPLLLGDSVVARDTLSVIGLERLRVEGMDPDTLPLLDDVQVTGSAGGTVALTGSLAALDVEARLSLEDASYGAQRVGAADVTFEGRGLRSPESTMSLSVDARDVDALELSFGAVEGRAGLTGRSGSVSLDVRRGAAERYRVGGDFTVDSTRAVTGVLREAHIELDSLAWDATRPTRVAWDSTSVYVEDLEVVRAGEDPMRLRATGTYAWAGESDFTLEGEGLHLERLARLAQRTGMETAGHMDLSVRVHGPATAPVLGADVSLIGPRWEGVAFDSLGGSLSYAERSADVRLEAWRGARRTFRAGGRVPVELALRHEGSRVVEAPMDVRVVADSLRAASAFATLDFLEDVVGVVSGEFRIAGTVERPEPSGTLSLENAGWTLEALGVRHDGVTGNLTLHPDRVVDVRLSALAPGRTDVTGTVTLEPLANPRLDLAFTLQGVRAVDRRDLSGDVSGSFRLTGTYGRPLAEGALTVDQGTLFLEEFARSAEVIDLSDPRLVDQLMDQVVDTAALSARPLIADIRNPFFDSLRVNVDLAVPRDTWLRSSDMNVEIGGELLVVYDRGARDLVLVGELEALRGSYAVLGRTFDVREGTVGFAGIPGINPTFDIEAVTRIRRREGDPQLEVTANVEGTLTQPSVTLSTEEQGVAESDLVSYLIFGRPSYELATPRGGAFAGAGGAVLGAAAAGTVTWATGAIATRFGAAVAQQLGIDYLSVSQAGDFSLASGLGSSLLAGTQIEVGEYLGEDVFFVLIFRPLTDQSGGRLFSGARVEWALSDPYTVEGFVEDRFLRSGVGGFRDLGFQPSRVLGVFIFREWAY